MPVIRHCSSSPRTGSNPNVSFTTSAYLNPGLRRGCVRIVSVFIEPRGYMCVLQSLQNGVVKLVAGDGGGDAGGGGGGGERER